MEKRMNKEELIELIKSINLDKNDFFVLSSGALVLRDIFPNAGDLDIAVTSEALEKLKKVYNLVKKPNGFYIVNDKVECVVDDNAFMDSERMPEEASGYQVQNIHIYYDYLKTSEREKDKERVALVEKYIEKNYRER